MLSKIVIGLKPVQSSNIDYWINKEKLSRDKASEYAAKE